MTSHITHTTLRVIATASLVGLFACFDDPLPADYPDDPEDRYAPEFAAELPENQPDDNEPRKHTEHDRTPSPDTEFELPEEPPELKFDDDGVAPFDGIPHRLAPGTYVVLVRGAERTCTDLERDVMEHTFRSVASDLADDIAFAVVDREAIPAFNASAWPYSGLTEVIVVRDGTVVDRHSETTLSTDDAERDPNRISLRHLLARNDLVDKEPDAFFLAWELPATFGLANRTLGPIDATDKALRRVSFQDSFLSGTRLTGADLREANFAGTTFAGVDLEGADVDGALFRDNTWLNTTCPDGSHSTDHGGDCPPVSRKPPP